ncbi:hypothetical protein ACX0G9_30595 [Flavitalea flava]
MLFLLILLLGFIAHFIIPFWWSIVPVAFFSSFFLGKRKGHAFWMGFLSNALLWLVLILIKISGSNTVLIQRSAKFLFLPNWVMLFMVTLLIGGLVSGFSSLAGSLVKTTFKSHKKTAVL